MVTDLSNMRMLKLTIGNVTLPGATDDDCGQRPA